MINRNAAGAAGWRGFAASELLNNEPIDRQAAAAQRRASHGMPDEMRGRIV